MRILHVSDTHGLPPEPPKGGKEGSKEDDFDVVVHSGDLMPNTSFGVAVLERAFQPRWLEQNAKHFPKGWYGKPVIMVPGNHDYVDPTPALRSVGLDVQLLVDDVVEIGGVRFWGHPWTPPFYDWNYMLPPAAMSAKLARLADEARRGGVHVLVSHGPMYGVLDRNQSGERCGCPQLRHVVTEASGELRMILHGHIHESAGLMKRWVCHPHLDRPRQVSNAACTQRTTSVPVSNERAA